MDDPTWIPVPGLGLPSVSAQSQPIPQHTYTFVSRLTLLALAGILGICLTLVVPWPLALWCMVVVFVGLDYARVVGDCDKVCEAIYEARLVDLRRTVEEDRIIEAEAQEFAATGQIATVAQLEECQRHRRRAGYGALGSLVISLVGLLIWIAPWEGTHAPACVPGEVYVNTDKATFWRCTNAHRWQRMEETGR